MGHLAYLIAKVVDPKRIVCMDLLPGFVYSTRRFFVPDALATLTYDMNKPLPLADGKFSMVYCFDSFQHLTDKPQRASEFMRILNGDGVLVIGRSPNRFFPGLYSHDALSPAEHYELFKDYPARVFPEGYLVDQYLNRGPIDLSRRFPMEELDKARNLDIVVARSESVFSSIPNVSQKLLDAAARPRLNDLYGVSQSNGAMRLDLRLPEALAEEYARFPQILPRQLSIPGSDVRHSNGTMEFVHQRELLEKHVLEDLPADY
jgi:SAM-dependent methyltransferase